MIIPKNYLIAGISTLLIAGAGVAYYISTQDNPETLGWMSTSWLYRKSISVSNSGSTLTNEDVLIEVDTASLVTASKLQSDCDDLRFTDSDESTTLTYWVEAGCNTATTQIWVQIPSLTSGGKTIYMYYGNSSATNSEASWSGDFVLLNNSSCPSGWTRTSTYDNKFPYGAASYGGTGGALSHTQGSPSCTTGGPSPSNQYTQSDSGGATASPTHTHTNAKVDVDSANNLPPYLDMVYCTNTDLNISSGLITLFTSTPSGWTRFSSLDSKFARGASSYGGTGGATTHTHTTTGGYTTGSSGTRTDSPGGDVGAGNHTHTTANGTTGSGDSLPPYLDMIFASKDSGGYATSSLISMTTAAPPLGWTRYSSLDSKFARGASTQGGTGGTTTHTHSVTISTNSGPSGASSTGSRAISAAPTNHTHSCTATTDSASHVPAYIDTLYYQRKSSQSATLGSEEVGNTVPNAPSSLQTEGATNPVSITDSTPEFSAVFSDPDTADTGNYYRIQVNTSSSFDGTSMWDSTKTSISPTISNGNRSSDIAYAGSTLQIGTTYYWRIKFWDNKPELNESDWSSTAQFTMNAAPTAPTTPHTQGSSNPLKITTATPYFSAIFNDPDTSDSGIYYQIQVNTASDFSGTTKWDSTKISTTTISNGTRSGNITYNGTTLDAGITYYWKIKFWDNNDYEGTWSTANQFTMQGTPYAPTDLQVNGATNPTQLTNIAPLFSAIYTDPNQDAASAYQINVNTNSSFTGTSLWDSGKTATTITHGQRSLNYQYAGTAMSNSHNTYYWRIKFWDSDDTASEWSTTGQFTDTFSSFQFEGVGMNGIKLD